MRNFKIEAIPGSHVDPRTVLAQAMELPFRGILVLGILDRASLNGPAKEAANENFVMNFTGVTLDEIVVLLKKASVIFDRELMAHLQPIDDVTPPEGGPHVPS